MSSPYQSKLFNFLNRQSQQWRDRATMAARHLQVAAEWGVQILLYPIYLMVQAGRRTGQQLGLAASQSQLPPSPATGDEGDKGDKEKRGEIAPRISPPQSQLSILISTYLERIDRRLADWEAQPSNPVKELVSQVNQQFQGLVSNRGPIFDKIAFLSHINLKFSEIQHFNFKSSPAPAGAIQNSAGGTAIASERAEELDPFRIQVLIRAGIDYFFGQRRGKKHLSANGTVLPPSEGKIIVEDPWLVWEDLFPEQLSNRVSVTELEGVQAGSPSLPAGLPTPAQPGTSWRQRRQRGGKKYRQSTALRTRPTVANQLTEKQVAEGQIATSPPSSTSVIPVSEGEETLETAFDWLEAKVTPAGYVKHPLEQILEGLDLLILWLEEWLEKGWQWLRQRLEF